MRKSRVMRLFSAALFVSVALTACGSENSQQPSGTADGIPPSTAIDTTASGDPLRIGATVALTGAFAETGRVVNDAYQSWVERTNSDGGLLGRQIELIIEDDGGDASRATSLLRRLIESEGVDLILGGYPGSSVASQMALAEEFEMVYVSMGGHMQSFQQGYEWSFGGPPLMGEWWYVGLIGFLESLEESERPQTVAMVTINNPVGLALRQSAVDAVEELGLELVMDEQYEVPLESPETLVSQAQEQDADLFFANGFFDDGVQIMHAVHTVGYEPMGIVHGAGSLVPAWQSELGDDGNFVFSGTVMNAELDFPMVVEANQAAEERYGEPLAPDYFLFGWSWIDVLSQAVEGVGSVDSQAALADWLRSNSVETPAGTLTFDEQGLPERFQFLTQVIEGRAEVVWPEDVATNSIVFPIPWNE